MSKISNEGMVDLGCLGVVIIFNFIAGGMSVNYILAWFGKSLPFIADGLIGLIVGELSIPVALFGWTLRCFGVF